MKKLLLVVLAVFSIALGGLSVNAFAAVNLNTATQAELESIKGIGPVKAKAIIDYRAKTPFKSVDDLDNVKGFGKKSVDKFRNEVSVSGASTPVAADTKKAATPAKMAAPAATEAAPAKTDKMAAARAAKAKKAADAKAAAAEAKPAAPAAADAAPVKTDKMAAARAAKAKKAADAKAAADVKAAEPKK